MSGSGPSAPGTLLVQRLDAVLGTTLAQQARLAGAIRPDAVSRPGGAADADPSDTVPGRDPRQAAGRVDARAGRQARHDAAAPARAGALPAGLDAGPRTDRAGTASAPTTLGPAARAILALLARYPDAAPPAAGRAPLWQPGTATEADTGAGTRAGAGLAAPSRPNPAGRRESPPHATAAAAASPGGGAPSARALATALARALEGSGLFYESHLASLAFGGRGAARLADAPQARWTRPAAGLQPAAGEASAAARRGAARPADAAPSSSSATAPATAAVPGSPGAPASSGTPGPSGLPRTPGLAGAPSPSGPSAPATHASPAPPAGDAQGSPVPGLPAEAALIVRQQLEVLAHQAFCWQGEAWPGASMTWRVGREGGEPDPEQEAPAAAWSTRLALELPRLGRVQAWIGLSGQRVTLRLAGGRADELRARSGPLRLGMRAAGLALDELSVARALATDGGEPSWRPE